MSRLHKHPHLLTLNDEQAARLTDIARARGMKKVVLLREAVDRYFAEYDHAMAAIAREERLAEQKAKRAYTHSSMDTNPDVGAAEDALGREVAL